MKLIIMGPPGAGKGTQANVAAEKYGIPHVSTGDILRDAIKNGSTLGEAAQNFMDAGRLVPDHIVIKLTLKRLEQDDCKNGFILDGFPRTPYQAQEFWRYQKIDMVLSILVDEANLINRITGRRSCEYCGEIYHIEARPSKKEDICDECGMHLIRRPDDTEEVLKERLSVYREETQPLIDYYSDLNIMYEINGNQSIKDIQAEIDQTLEILHDFVKK